MNNESLRVSLDGPVLTVRLNRPRQRNALDGSTLTELIDLFSATDRNPDITVVVLAGEGPTFSAGGDLAELHETAVSTPDLLPELLDRGRDACAAIANARPVTIAQLHGRVYGAGIALAVHADLRLAADTTTFQFPELALGIPPTWGEVTHRFVGEIGAAAARDLILLGEPIDAATAGRIGLLHRVIAAEDLAEQTHRTARRIAGYDPAAVAVTKTAMRQYELATRPGTPAAHGAARLAEALQTGVLRRSGT